MIERYSRPEMAKIWTLQNKFQKWLELELAACKVLSKKGQIPAASLKVILEKAKFDVARVNEIEKETNHDVIAFLTNVAEYVGPDSRYIHMGLTSSDVVDTCLMVQLKEAGQILVKAIDELMIALKTQSQKYKKTVMIGRTHGIHAEPMTFGLKLALYYEEMKRNRERLTNAIETISVGKLSGAVGTYGNIDPEVETEVCKAMGLKPAVVSNQILQRDRHAEFVTTLAITAGTLEKLAVEIRLLQKTDTHEAAEPFGKGQKGSSAMPHKRNPIMCERITGLARVVRGYALTSLENQALWHERDISHSGAERVIFPDATGFLDYMLVKMTDIINGIEVYEDNMLVNLNKWGGIVFSGRLLLEFVKKGITREDAYKIVQRNALAARDQNGSFLENISKDPEALKLLSVSEIKESFQYDDLLPKIEMIFKRVF
jgi:adenylosuccinate lyase